MFSPLRILVLAAVCVTGVGAFIAFPQSSEGAQWILIRLLVVIGPLLLVIAAEADERRARTEARGTPHWVLAPFIPGNGRGIAFVLTAIFTVLAWFLAARAVHARGEPLFGDDDPTQLAAICLFALSYCLIVALLARRWPLGAARFVRLIAILVGGLAVALASPILGANGMPDWCKRILSPLTFPPRLLECVRQDGHWNESGWIGFLVLCSLAGILAVLSLPRMTKGVSEVVIRSSGRESRA